MTTLKKITTASQNWQDFISSTLTINSLPLPTVSSNFLPTAAVIALEELGPPMIASMNNMIDLIKYPVITEKSYLTLFRHKQYTFDVDLRLSKPQIKKLFENLFNVNIIAVNTHIPPRKNLRVGTKKGYQPRYKRVILTLKKGQTLKFSIPLT